MQSYCTSQAVEIANRINAIMRDQEPGTQPATVLTALCAVMARLIGSLREEDRETAFQQAVALVRAHAGLGPRS